MMILQNNLEDIIQHVVFHDFNNNTGSRPTSDHVQSFTKRYD